MNEKIQEKELGSKYLIELLENKPKSINCVRKLHVLTHMVRILILGRFLQKDYKTLIYILHLTSRR